MNRPAHNALAVANYLLRRARDRGVPLTPMKLIKLAYLCHGWTLGITDRRLIQEPIEAWQYGPVIRSIYSNVRQYRSSPITDQIKYPGWESAIQRFDATESEIMNQVFDIYSQYSAIQLSNMTHIEGSPWWNTWNKSGQNAEIPDEEIRLHFKRYANDG